MRYKYLALLVIIVSIALGVSIYQPPAKTAQNAPETVSQPISKAPTAQELLTLVNTERAKVGTRPLVMDERLNQSAQAKADDMKANNYFGHVNPKTGKNGPTYVLDVANGLCSYQSENITQNIYENSSKRAVDAWIASKNHYEAMISSDYDLTGFGIADNYIVEHFCDVE